MKEFDIYLNKRLTECDIIVRSIPCRYWLTAINRLILESYVGICALTKFIAAQSGIELFADIGGGDRATKYLTVQNAVSILASAAESIRQFMEPDEGALALNMDASCILKRYRLLGEMDNDELLSYDDMTLEDVDFVIL